jgi:hypothetical protein
MAVYARCNKRVVDGEGTLEDPAQGWTRDDEEHRPGSENENQPGGGLKPIFEDSYSEGEQAHIVTKGNVSEYWVRDKYKGVPFMEEDLDVPEHRVVFGVKWYRGKRTGPVNLRRSKGWYVQTEMDPVIHPDKDDDEFTEDYPINADLWDMIRASPAAQAKYRFKSQLQ